MMMMMCFIKGFAKILENTLLLTLKRLGFKSISGFETKYVKIFRRQNCRVLWT